MLAKAGFQCYLGSKLQIHHLMNSLNGYIYLDKGYHRGVSEKLYEIVKRHEGYIVNLDEEGGIDYSDNSTLKGRYSSGLFEAADLILFWGSVQQHIVSHQETTSVKTEVTGHPRFEMLKPEFHFLYQNDVNSIKSKHGKFILINTNMGFGNNIKGDEFVVANYGERFRNINQIISFDKSKLNVYRSLVLALASQTDENIIIRPHPEENRAYYQKAFNGQSKVKVLYDGSVIPWLLAADYMIHPDCTTAIESLLLGKKALSYLPTDYDKEVVTELPLRASVRFSQEEEIVKYINTSISRSDVTNWGEYPFVESYFSYSKPATELIVKEILKMKEIRGAHDMSDITWSNVLLLEYRDLRRRIKNDVAVKLLRNKLKGFNFKNITTIHERISSHLSHTDVSCQRISAGLFKFRNHDIGKIEHDLDVKRRP